MQENIDAMGLLSWILFGLVAGLIAKAFYPGNDAKAWIGAITIGILGSLLGGWIAINIGWGTTDRFYFRTMMLSIISCVLFLWIWARYTRRRIRIKQSLK